ncbi:MAG: tyrosine-type recombinase/integrase [Actinomycetota bacterium]|nr:tyrosine-type recombinase/integrase [Actinomycetota bacterium]
MNSPNRWTPRELAAFFAAVGGTRLEGAWHLAGGGLRIGELLALRWSDVDLTGRCVVVRNAVFGVPYTSIAPSPISPRGRWVGLDADLVAALAKHRARQEAEQTEFGSEYSSHELAVCREDGRPIHPRSLSRTFAALVARAGLPPIELAAIRQVGPAPSIRAGTPT